ncbi:hypothetical protein Hanom_Chr04g00328631 [Helianthus anomalus]
MNQCYFKKNEEIAAQQAQKENVQDVETKKSSINEDSDATQSESELVAETLGSGKAQLKKRPSKKQRDSNEKDSPYDPDQSRKNRKKRKTAPAGVIPRNVRAKKSSAESQKEIEGKKKQDEVEKTHVVEIPKEVPTVESKKTNDDDDYVEITGYKPASPKPAQQEIPGSSQQRDDCSFNFDDLGTATGIFSKDMPEGESDMFNDEKVKELILKVKELEKEKARAEIERNELKSQVEELMVARNKVVAALVEKESRMNKMKDDVEDSSKVFDSLTSEIASLNAKIKDLQNVNQTLNQLLNEMSEASSNEMKAMKLEM